jgi:hypothetical protein
MTDAKKVTPPSPVVQHVASRPCRLCGGGEYSHFPSVQFDAIGGSRSHFFELLVCRACHKADLFARLEELERPSAAPFPYAILRVPGTVPHR